jgi:outer membrane lipoprotein-sorting protein
MMVGTIRLGLLGLLIIPSPAQSQPDLLKVLNQVSTIYKAASQYQIEAELTVIGAKAGPTSHFFFAFKAPDKYHMQGAIPGAPAGESDLGESLAVDDGTTLWFYFSKPNQYGSIPATALTADAPGDLGDARPEAMDHFMMWRYRAAADFPDQAKFLRDESIGIAGNKIDCYVVTVSPQRRGPSYTWWIDKTRNVVRREDNANSSTIFTSIKLNEPIRDELFKFEPPPGAQKVQMQP